MKAELKVTLEEGQEKIYTATFDKNDYKRLERRFEEFERDYNKKYIPRKREITDKELQEFIENDPFFINNEKKKK